MTADLLTVCIVAGPLTILLLLSLLRCGRRKCFRTPHSGQTYLRFETDDGLSSDDPLRQDAQQEEHGFRMASFNGSTGGDRRPWSNFTHDKSGTAAHSGQTYLRFESDDGLSSDDPLRQDAQQEEHGVRMASFNGSTGGDRRPWSNFTHDKSGTAVNVRFGNRQRSPLFSQMPEIMEAHVLTVLLVLRFWPAPFVLLPR